MKLGFAGIVIGVAMATQVAAQDAASSVVLQQVQQCISKTRAPGSYQIVDFDSIPVVEANSGGTAAGAHNVNDCLQDSYSVQYSVGAFGLDEKDAKTAVEACRSKRPAEFVLGTVLTAGVVVALGGSVGGGVVLGALSSAAYSRPIYERCLRKAGVTEDAGVRYASSCSRHSDVMHGGGQYCR